MVAAAHLSNKLQVLDITVSNALKIGIRYYLSTIDRESAIKNRRNEHNLDTILLAIKYGYFRSFTNSSIKSGFKRSGLCPLSIKEVVNSSLRKSKYDETLVSPDSILILKNNYSKEILENGHFETEVKSGYVDSTFGIELTRDDVLQLAVGLENNRAIKSRQNELNQIAGSIRSKSEYAKRVLFAKRLSISKMIDRNKRHGTVLKLPRTMKQRRIAAKTIILEKKLRAERRVLN